jgi:LytS/YehU family sensor histidine kinase
VDALRVARERVARDLREQQMQRLASEAELRALRAQLNPHFLFNALTTIGYLIQHAPSRAVDTLMRLTQLLRGVLRRSAAEFSTLGDEIELVRSYLEIERARFEERLQVSIDVDPVACDVLIPTLLLQPLVENAVKHGIAPRGEGGDVRITGALREGRLFLVVADSGIGFDVESGRQGTGVGLRTAADRLRVHYVDEAALVIRSVHGLGTTIEIELPATPSFGARRRAG